MGRPLDCLPCEHFAEIGKELVLDKIGKSEPDHDWSEEGGNESDHEKYVAARLKDEQRIADWLKKQSVKQLLNYNGMDFGGNRIMWPDRVPCLKAWAGQQTLSKITQDRQKALGEDLTDILSFEAPVAGASGIDKSVAGTALEDGFSANAIGMQRVTRVGMELLAILGIDTLPITAYPDGKIGYDHSGWHWVFSIEKRNEYYWRWGMASAVREAPWESHRN